MTNATVGVDGTRPHRGQWSLHVQIPAVAADSSVIGTIRQHAALPQLNQPFFLRAWLYTSSWAPTPKGHEALLKLKDTGGTNQALQLEMANGVIDFNDYNAPAGMGRYQQASSGLPVAQWFCLEWELSPTAALSGDSHVWLNEVELSELALQAVSMPMFGEMQLGFDLQPSGAQPAIDLWIDDVLADSSYVPCAR